MGSPLYREIYASQLDTSEGEIEGIDLQSIGVQRFHQAEIQEASQEVNHGAS
jgi:hypothetical protein